MRDHVERFGRSLLQHGPHNDRVYLMHLDREDHPAIIGHMEDLAGREGYGKIFAKVPLSLSQDFMARDYRMEALIPPRKTTEEGGLAFASRFLQSAREQPRGEDRIATCLNEATARAQRPPPLGLPPRCVLERCGAAEAEMIAGIYRKVFGSYPFPIDDPDHIREAMRGNTIYYGVRDGDNWVAAAAAEMDPAIGLVEMTDFATLLTHRGKSFSHALLRHMERDVAEIGIDLAYTIARATMVGMNVTFARCGYSFAGTLVNNTQIDGAFESMNVWYRYLSVPGEPGALSDANGNRID